MIINSPVGRFPFTVTSVLLKNRTVVLEGRMGTWPASLEASPRDVAEAATRLSPGLIGLGVMVVAAVAGLGVLIGSARTAGD